MFETKFETCLTRVLAVAVRWGSNDHRFVFYFEIPERVKVIHDHCSLITRAVGYLSITSEFRGFPVVELTSVPAVNWFTFRYEVALTRKNKNLSFRLPFWLYLLFSIMQTSGILMSMRVFPVAWKSHIDYLENRRLDCGNFVRPARGKLQRPTCPEQTQASQPNKMDLLQWNTQYERCE